MKPLIARQSLLTAATILLLLAAGGFMRLYETTADFSAEWTGSFGGAAAERLLRFPLLGSAAGILLLLFTGLTLGRIGIRYKLYAVGNCLGVSLFGMLACGIYIGADYLSGLLAAFLLARSLRNYCASFRNGYTFDALFRASAYLGFLPLIYPTALPLALLLPWALLCFKRTLREATVAATGLFLPAAAVCYIRWARGGQFTDPLAEVWHALRTPADFRLFDTGSEAVPFLLGFALFLTLCAALFFLGERYASGSKARTILTFDLGVLVLSGSLFFLPSASGSLFGLAAVPAALLLPYLFVRIRPAFALAGYGFLLILCVLRLAL